jgi:hypothetical protein
MRRTIPMRWNEEAEARKVRLLAAESMPASAANGGATKLPKGKTSVTALLARMTGRVTRLTRARPSRGRSDQPTEGSDCVSKWRVGAGCPVYSISERRLLDRRAA